MHLHSARVSGTLIEVGALVRVFLFNRFVVSVHIVCGVIIVPAHGGGFDEPLDSRNLRENEVSNQATNAEHSWPNADAKNFRHVISSFLFAGIRKMFSSCFFHTDKPARLSDQVCHLDLVEVDSADSVAIGKNPPLEVHVLTSSCVQTHTDIIMRLCLCVYTTCFCVESQ